MKQFTRWFLVMVAAILVRSAVAQDVLTQHNDLARTGWYPYDTVLNVNNVNKNTFGLAYTLPVDEKIFAQPLVVQQVNIPNVGYKNLVFVCTVKNSVYAFDADVAGTAYWQKNFTNVPLANARLMTGADIFPSLCTPNAYYNDFPDSVGNRGYIGIVGTPVIDKSSGTMYFVTKVVDDTVTSLGWQANQHWEYTYRSAGFHQFLHAIDIATGLEKANSPVEIKAQSNGTGDGQTAPGIITFDPRRQFNRAGLALSNGIVYIAFAAHCDNNPCHGWLLGYNAQTLARQIVYNATPNDGRGGIWMSGGGPAIDENGNIYFTTGNSLDESHSSSEVHVYNSDPSVRENRGESVVRLTPNTLDGNATSVTISSFFTPFTYMALNDLDLDFGIQTMLVPGTNMLITGCKDDSLYIMDRNNLGGFNLQKNNILQTKFVSDPAPMHASFAYFGGANPFFYQWSENTQLLAYPIVGNSLGTPITGGGTMSGPNDQSGTYMSVSSNGTDPSTAILWASQMPPGYNGNSAKPPMVLRAYKASDVRTELWNNQMTAGDNVGLSSKMVCPTIANGKVYEPTGSGFLAVYGLKNNTTCVTNVAQGKTATAMSSTGTANNVTDGRQNTSWTSAGGDNQYIYIDMASRFDFCRVIINWRNTNAQNFNIDVSEDKITWTNVDSVVNNTSSLTDFYGSFTGRYVRMQGKKSVGGAGYSINEFQIFGHPASPCATPSNLIVPNPTSNSATVHWNPVSGATQYLIQYKPDMAASWINRAVSVDSVNLGALSCDFKYDVTVQAVCGTTSQSTISLATFNAGSCSGSCGGLPTRHYNLDIGDVGLAGSTCTLPDSVYNITGSGAITGTADAFQFTFTAPAAVEEAFAQIISQDNINGNKAGVMIRDSLTDISRFAYVAAVSNGSNKNIIFQYRSIPGGPTTTVNIASNISLPYWVKVIKAGTQYAPALSIDGSNWTQPTSPVDLGFGNDALNIPDYGLAVTSSDNSKLSNAHIGFFNVGASGTPLPIQLESFTAQNINNDHVLISWSTSMEQNVDHFEVQRSIDGNNYDSLTQVNAAGNSQTLKNYSAIDNQPGEGTDYYRLKEVDSDGRAFLSPVAIVQFGKSVDPWLRPNPAISRTEVVSTGAPILEVTLYDILGKRLRKIENTSGALTVPINIAALETGVYIVRIKTATKTYQQKLFKQ